MKKMIQIEATFCDYCGKQDYVEKCLGCGIEYCLECKKILGVQYPDFFNSFSTGGFFCNICDTKFLKDGNNALHTAYKRIKDLQNESKLFYDDLMIRVNKSEIVLKKLQKF